MKTTGIIFFTIASLALCACTYSSYQRQERPKGLSTEELDLYKKGVNHLGHAKVSAEYILRKQNVDDIAPAYDSFMGHFAEINRLKKELGLKPITREGLLGEVLGKGDALERLVYDNQVNMAQRAWNEFHMKIFSEEDISGFPRKIDGFIAEANRLAKLLGKESISRKDIGILNVSIGNGSFWLETNEIDAKLIQHYLWNLYRVWEDLNCKNFQWNSLVLYEYLHSLNEVLSRVELGDTIKYEQKSHSAFFNFNTASYSEVHRLINFSGTELTLDDLVGRGVLKQFKRKCFPPPPKPKLKKKKKRSGYIRIMTEEEMKKECARLKKKYERESRNVCKEGEMCFVEERPLPDYCYD